MHAIIKASENDDKKTAQSSAQFTQKSELKI